MSMNLHVYVGPFLKCYPRGVCGVDTLTGGRLQDLCGEGPGRAYDVLGPNVDVPGIDRPLTWERTGESDFIAEPEQALERTAFIAAFDKEMRDLRNCYQRVELTWGVVPGWF